MTLRKMRPDAKAVRLETAVAVVAGILAGVADSLIFHHMMLVSIGAGIGIALGAWAVGRSILDMRKQ